MRSASTTGPGAQPPTTVKPEATWRSGTRLRAPTALIPCGRELPTDSGGLSSTSDRVDVVVDNVDVDEPPVADAGADRSLTDADGNGSEPVTLDASSSRHDPQRTASYTWEVRHDGGPAMSLGSGAQRPAELDIGINVVTLTVADSLGNGDQDEVVITVRLPTDAKPPTAAWIEPAAGAAIEKRPLTLGATVADAGGSGLAEIVFRAKWVGDGHVISTFRNPGSPVGLEWDMCAAGVPGGDVELALRALDLAGNQFDSHPRRVSKRFDCNSATAPTLTLSPEAAAPGEEVEVTASGFEPGETVTITWDKNEQPKTESKNKKKHKNTKGKKGKKGKRGQRGQPSAQPVSLGSATAAVDGDISLRFTVPDKAAPGKHRVEAVGSRGNRAAVTLDVTSGAPRIDSAGAGSAASDPDAPAPLPAADRGEEEALLPAEAIPLASEPPKRKPGKNRDRAGRDDRGKSKQKHAHAGQRRAKQGNERR